MASLKKYGVGTCGPRGFYGTFGESKILGVIFSTTISGQSGSYNGTSTKNCVDPFPTSNQQGSLPVIFIEGFILYITDVTFKVTNAQFS